MLSPENTAWPLALVRTLELPPRVPPALTATETEMPPEATLLLPLSRSCTTGCWANATPLPAPADGWVVITSWVAGPADSAMVLEVAVVSVPELNVRV